MPIHRDCPPASDCRRESDCDESDGNELQHADAYPRNVRRLLVLLPHCCCGLKGSALVTLVFDVRSRVPGRDVDWAAGDVGVRSHNRTLGGTAQPRLSECAEDENSADAAEVSPADRSASPTPPHAAIASERHDTFAGGEQSCDLWRAHPSPVNFGQVLVGRPTGDGAASSDEDRDLMFAQFGQQFARRRQPDSRDADAYLPDEQVDAIFLSGK